MSWRWWAIGTICVGLPVLIGLSGCAGHESEAAATAAVEAKPVPVTVTPLVQRRVERTVDAVGTLRGWEDVNVGTKKPGRVLRVLHDMGDRVRPGAKLVELDPTDAQLTLAQAQSRYLAELTRLGITRKQAEDALARFGITEDLLLGAETTRIIEQTPAIQQTSVAVEKAQVNLTRQRNLNARGAGTLEDLQNYENDHRAALAARDAAIATARNIVATAIASKIAIDAAKQSLSDLTIVAPEPTNLPDFVDRSKLEYAITRRSASEGQMLKEGEGVMQLVIETPLRLWTTVPERYSGEVQLGQPVRVSVASYPGRTFDGKVARINPQVDPVSRTFQVETVVPNAEGLLRPGGFAKADVVTRSSAEAKVVPVESVMRYAGVTKVFVIEQGKARAINVETGLEGAGWVEVTGELPEGASIVTTGQSQLADGTAVVVRTPSETKPGSAPAPAKSAAPAHAG